MSIEGFYNRLVLSRIHHFPKVWQDIIFIINGQCCVCLEIIYSLEKWFGAISPLDKIDTVFRVQVDFIKGRYPRFSGKFIDSLKTHIEHAPRIQDAYCCRYPWMKERRVIPEAGLTLFGGILFIALTHVWSVSLFFNHQYLIFFIGLHLFEAKSVKPRSINNIQYLPMSRCIFNYGQFSNTLGHLRR